MESIEFRVQGSEPEPYIVTFRKQGDNLSAECTCRAAEMEMYCKHRTNIFNGITKGIVSENIEDVKIVVEWLKGSKLEKAFEEVKATEEEIKAMQENLKNLKRKVSRLMMGSKKN